MKIQNFTLWVLLLLLTGSCAPGQKSGEKYFDFEGFIDDQVDLLSQSGRVLDKAAEVGGERSDSTFLPSAIGWKSELEMFRQLETINKPAYRGAYRVEDPVEDLNSNLKIRAYSASTAPVTFVRFYYHNHLDQLKKIEAVITEKNLLYSTTRTMAMEFEDDDGKPTIVRYSMNGFQKMILYDTVRFSVTGEINW